MNISFNNYDFIFSGIILASVILAIIRGGINELLSLSTWFIALLMMRHFKVPIGKIIPAFISNPMLRSLASYICVFIASAIIMALIKKLFARFISALGLNGLNYLLGAIFGFIRGVIIAALIVIAGESFNLDPNHLWKNSHFSRLLSPVIEIIINNIPKNLKNFN